VVRFDRNGLGFIPGQHISVGLANDQQAREYSIYSSIHEPFLEILVKEVKDGIVSKKLKRLKTGDQLRVSGPMGFFKLSKAAGNEPHLLVASGTGISPFHSYVKSYQGLQYRLVHGVRHFGEAYDSDHYSPKCYTLCTSRDQKGSFRGRVTDYLRSQIIAPETQAYLCGNCDMVFEVYDILTDKGLRVENIHTEVYF
jgi:ferredoxin/flavodoxin---NADP+ reductase